MVFQALSSNPGAFHSGESPTLNLASFTTKLWALAESVSQINETKQNTILLMVTGLFFVKYLASYRKNGLQARASKGLFLLYFVIFVNTKTLNIRSYER
jgi:hypothetical protein